MTDDEFLWKLYEDNRRQAQVHEDRRSAATAVIVGGGGALATAMGDADAANTDTWLAFGLIFLGLAGWLIALKATERMRLHNSRTYALLDALNALLPNANAAALKKNADAKHKKDYPLSARLQLSLLWQWLNLAIALAGVAMLLFLRPDWRDALLSLVPGV